MMEEYTRRRNAMAAVFDELGVTYSMPRGAFYFWANISGAGSVLSSSAARALVDHAILFFPGSMYGDEGEGYARISFLAPPDQARRGARALRPPVPRMPERRVTARRQIEPRLSDRWLRSSTN